MGEAVLDGRRRVRLAVGTIHRLEEEVGEVEVLVPLGFSAFLPVDELQLVAVGHHDIGVGLRAHAHPVDPVWYRQSSVGLDGDLEAAVVQRRDQWPVELHQRLTTRTHDEAGRAGDLVGVGGELVRTGEMTTAGSISADEVGVAKAADGGGALLLAPGPQVATGEAAEDGGASRVGALPLEGGEHLFDDVAHQAYLVGSSTPA